jgi:hypothetical protein
MPSPGQEFGEHMADLLEQLGQVANMDFGSYQAQVAWYHSYLQRVLMTMGPAISGLLDAQAQPMTDDEVWAAWLRSASQPDRDSTPYG